MGYLFCGPVGTGKTFFVECLAGEAGVPVVKMKNFRDKWVGSTEGNLERIFRLLHALGRCIVFVDEADQALGRRESSSNDSGVSGRIYSMIAEEMSDTDNRGKILWILASSRPDLIEVDLKRPGRIDVKIPLFPTLEPREGFTLLRALCKRVGSGDPGGGLRRPGGEDPGDAHPGGGRSPRRQGLPRWRARRGWSRSRRSPPASRAISSRSRATSWSSRSASRCARRATWTSSPRSSAPVSQAAGEALAARFACSEQLRC